MVRNQRAEGNRHPEKRTETQTEEHRNEGGQSPRRRRKDKDRGGSGHKMGVRDPERVKSEGTESEKGKRVLGYE